MFRELRRKKQALSVEECEEILRTEKRGCLCMLGDDDYPYGVPINFVYLDGKLYFHSGKKGYKMEALAVHDKVCFTVWNGGTLEEGSWWYHVDSVICFGRIRVVDDDELKLRSLFALGSKYFPPAERDTNEEIEKGWNAVQMLELTIEHMSGKSVKEE